MSSKPTFDPAPVRVVLFDLGGVVFDFDWQRAIRYWADAAHCSPEHLGQRFVRGRDYQRFERGELTRGEFFATLRVQLDVDLDDSTLVAGWNDIFGDLIPGITDLIGAVASSKLRMAALSNTNATHAVAFATRFAVPLARIGRIFASHEIGSRKPEPDAYHKVIDRLGVEPAAVLFFDDLAANVSGARTIGIQAVQVTSTDDVRNALTECEVVLPDHSSPGVAGD